MKTVGPDKRGQYYLLTATEVIADLKSHAMGLTNAEAARRLEAHGANALAAPSVPSRPARLFQQIHPLHLVMLVAGIWLAAYLQNGLLVAGLSVVALLQTALVLLSLRENKSPAITLDTLLPDRTRVIRNGQVSIASAHTLVVGDIVQLMPGDIVPADMRLTDTQGLITNDAPLFGGAAHVRKFTHALPSHVPLAARNNLAFAGTIVTTGEARGIVVATGMQTELGRITALNQAVPARATALELFSRWQQTVILWAVYGGVALCTILGLLTGASLNDVIRIVGAVFAIGATLLLPVIQTILEWRTRWVLGIGGVRVSRLQTAERLAETDILIFNPESFSSTDATVTNVMVGRTNYLVQGEGYSPAGKLTQHNGKALSKQDMRGLALVFEASALAHEAIVLPPDSQHNEWYVQGDPIDGALLAAARRAGLNTEKLRAAYDVIHTFPYDAHRQLRATVRRVGADTVLFVCGEPAAITARSSKLWDHGHVRNFTDGDLRHYGDHHTRRATEGASCVALAYRILPKRTSLTELTMEKAEQKLTFLGLFDIEHQSHQHTASLLQTMRASHIKVSLLSNRPQAYAVTTEALRRMSDAQLVERVQKGTATFSQLTADDKLRLVRAAQAAGHHVAMSAASLSDLPALRAADSAVSATAYPWLAASETVRVQHAEAVAAAPHVSRAMVSGLRLALYGAFIISIAVLGLDLVSAGATFTVHTPLAANPVHLLALLLLLQPIALSAMAWDASVGDTARTLRWLALPNRRHVATTCGLAAAAIGFASYLSVYIRAGVSPQYLDPASTFQVHATTLGFVALAVMLLVTIGALQSERFTQPHWRSYWDKSLVVGLIFAAAITALLVYHPALQSTFRTYPLDTGDWFLVLLGAAIYAAVLRFEQKTRHHSRHAIVQLHHDTFGKSSPARV